MTAPETIDADVVLLRRWRPEPAWAGGLATAIRESLPELKQFMPWAQRGYAVGDATGYLARAMNGWDDGTFYGYAIFTPADVLLGAIDLGSRNQTEPNAGAREIGYWLRTSYTRRGYMTAAVRALTRAALELDPGQQVIIRHDAANVASAAVARKAGFTEIARLRQEPQTPGETGVMVLRAYRKNVVPPS